MIKRTILFCLLITLFSACKSSKNKYQKGFDNGLFAINGVNCKEELDPNAMDSRVGTLDCGCVTFNYDYGKYSYQGPETMKEEFRRSFDVYHHTKFFENKIDPKVNKLFLDSVHVIEVRRKLKDDPLMTECETCSATAVLTFMGDTYFYPFTLSEKQLNRDESNIKFSIKGENSHKIYHNENELTGLYITPIQNRFMKKNCLSMTVANSDCTDQEVNKILNSVIITESID